MRSENVSDDGQIESTSEMGTSSGRENPAVLDGLLGAVILPNGQTDQRICFYGVNMAHKFPGRLVQLGLVVRVARQHHKVVDILGKGIRYVRPVEQLRGFPVERPILGAGRTVAAEVILILQFRLPQLLLVHGKVVAVIVQDFLTSTYPSDDSDGQNVAVANSGDVRVARMIDEAQNGHSSGADFTQVKLVQLGTARKRRRRWNSHMGNFMGITGVTLKKTERFRRQQLVRIVLMDQADQIDGHNGPPEEIPNRSLTRVANQTVDRAVVGRVVDAVEWRFVPNLGQNLSADFEDRPQSQQPVFTDVGAME